MTAMRLFGRISFVALVLVAAGAAAQEPPGSPPPEGPEAGRPAGPRMARPNLGPRKKGLVTNTDAAFEGYTLYTPLFATTTYLVDMKGREVHSWPSKYTGQAVYLLEDGSILRTAMEPGNRSFFGGGIGGRVQRIGVDGEVLWEFVHADDKHCLHHDIEPLPNGNILMIAWEKKTREEAIEAGRDPKRLAGDQFWPDYILEVAPEGKSGGKIVWEWHTWDHLVQQLVKTKANYGVVAEHPERIDINYMENIPRESPEEIRRLRAIGYVGGGEEDDEEEDRRPQGRRRGPGGPGMGADWLHTNSVAYNAELDQIILSIHNTHEIWVIDHSTTTEEAKGSTGGKSGKGGDLLYRWGNPRAYGAGTAADQQLFAQHDAQWIPEGSPGAGNITVFNNGTGRRGEPYSSVVEIVPPIGADGRYAIDKGKAFGPVTPVWEYVAPKKSDFFSSHISGAERLPNGNTLICNGEQGRFFEVARDGAVVWEYWNPHESRGPGGFFGGPRGGPRGGPPAGPPDGPGDGPPGAGRPNPDDGDDKNPQAGSGGDSPPGEGRARGGSPRDGIPASRPDGEDGPRRPGRGPGFGPPGPGFGPGGPGGGVFRVARLAANHPGIARILALHKDAAPAGESGAASPR